MAQQTLTFKDGNTELQFDGNLEEGELHITSIDTANNNKYLNHYLDLGNIISLIKHLEAIAIRNQPKHNNLM